MKHPITKYCETHRITFDDFAKGVKASKSMVSKWRNNKGNPSRRYLKNIYEFTNGEITANDILLPNEAA